MRGWGRRAGRWTVLGAVVFGSVTAAQADAVDEEFRFAAELIDRGFSDYGDRVIREALAENPDREQDASAVRSMLAIARGELDEAALLIKEIPDQAGGGTTLRLRLANAYYRANRIDEAQELYQAFFDSFSSAPTDPRQRKAYEEAGLYQAALLERAGEYAAAANSLAQVMGPGLTADRRRMFQARQAELWLRRADELKEGGREALLERVRKQAEDIEYGGAFWVARATLLRAEALRLSGEPKEALALLEKKKASYQRIDTALTEAGESLADSPTGGYHFFRGTILEEQGLLLAEQGADPSSPAAGRAKQVLAQALNEYARVVKTYGMGPFGTEATVRMKTVEDVLVDQFGARIKRTEPIQATPRNADDLYVEADTLYRKKEYPHAIEAYSEVLGRFPETEASPRALTNLARSYYQLEDLRMTDVVTGYLAERFAGDEEAAKGCLLLAAEFREAGDEDRAFDAYRLFAGFFPNHARAPVVLYTVAMAERQRSRGAVADEMLTQLVTRYTNSQYRLKGLMAVGAEAHRRESFDQAQAAFDAYVDAAPNDADRAKAWLLAGDCRLRAGAPAEAAKVFGELVDALDPESPGNPFYVEATTRSAVETLFEQATYQRAYALSRISEPIERVPAFRAAAVTLFDRFVDRFPRSALASKAMAAKGRILLEEDRMEEASAVFEALSSAYPDTPEGKNSLVTLVEAAISAGRMEAAVQAVERITRDPASYGEPVLARLGQLMVHNGQFAQAIAVYNLLLKAAEDDEWKERAYFGLGEAHLAQGECQTAVENLQALLTLNPNTGYFFDAQLRLAEALLACDSPDPALAALGDIFRLDEDADRRRRANFLLARIQAAQGRTADAFASYLRLALHPDPAGDPELAPLNRSSTLEALRLATETADWETVVLLADSFLKAWPKDPELDAVRQQRNRARVELSKQTPALGSNGA